MRKELPFVSTVLIAALALESCNAFEPKNAYAAPLPTDSSKTLALPAVDIAAIKKITLPTPYQVPTEVAPMINPTPEIKPFIYLSQNVLINEHTTDKSPKNSSDVTDVGCGMVDGAMVTRSDYQTYYKAFMDYFASQGIYGPARFTKEGTSELDHMAVLTSLGYKVTEVPSTTTQEELDVIIDAETAKNNYLWVGGDFYHKRHQSLIRGRGPDGRIRWNDPLYGENVEFPDGKVTLFDSDGNLVAKIFIIEAPTP